MKIRAPCRIKQFYTYAPSAMLIQFLNQDIPIPTSQKGRYPVSIATIIEIHMENLCFFPQLISTTQKT